MAAKDTPTFGDPEEPKSTDDLAKRLADVEAQLAAARAAAPLTLIPIHGAGPGDTVAETWSLADQEAAQAG